MQQQVSLFAQKPCFKKGDQVYERDAYRIFEPDRVDAVVWYADAWFCVLEGKKVNERALMLFKELVQ